MQEHALTAAVSLLQPPQTVSPADIPSAPTTSRNDASGAGCSSRWRLCPFWPYCNRTAAAVADALARVAAATEHTAFLAAGSIPVRKGTFWCARVPCTFAAAVDPCAATTKPEEANIERGDAERERQREGGGDSRVARVGGGVAQVVVMLACVCGTRHHAGLSGQQNLPAPRITWWWRTPSQSAHLSISVDGAGAATATISPLTVPSHEACPRQPFPADSSMKRSKPDCSKRRSPRFRADCSEPTVGGCFPTDCFKKRTQAMMACAHEIARPTVRSIEIECEKKIDRFWYPNFIRDSWVDY